MKTSAVSRRAALLDGEDHCLADTYEPFVIVSVKTSLLIVGRLFLEESATSSSEAESCSALFLTPVMRPLLIVAFRPTKNPPSFPPDCCSRGGDRRRNSKQTIVTFLETIDSGGLRMLAPQRRGVHMNPTKLQALVLTASVFLSSESLLAQEAARADPNTPSIIYFGEGLNQRVDGRHYFESQALFIEGEQGRHISRMENDLQQRSATGYGAISAVTGNARTNYVGGYTRKDGTYVRPHYRSSR